MSTNEQFKPVSDYEGEVFFINSTVGVVDAINERLAQLSAMTSITYGSGGDSFRGWNDEIQENFHEGINRLVTEVKGLFDVYQDQTK